jgi:tetratricopeptide (TPR) repeat protein
MADNDKQQKPEKKRAMELKGTVEYAKENGIELPAPETPRERQIAVNYSVVSRKHLQEAGADLYEAIVNGEEPYVQVVNDALENPDVRKKLNPNTAKIIIIENGCNPNLVDGSYLNEENVKSAVAKMEEREQWLGDREAKVMKREKELEAAEADQTEPNATAKCEVCGEDVPVGKAYQDRMTELTERERILEQRRTEVEAHEKAAEDNEYFVGREKLDEAGWKDEAQLGTYLEIMKPDVEPVTTESYTLNDGSLFKKAELATDSKIIGVKSAKPIKIEKRDEFFVTWQQKIDHYAVHVELWADEIANKADEKYAESYLKMVLGHVDAAVDSAKRNNFVRAYKHLEEARGIPIPPGRRLVSPSVYDDNDEEAEPPAPPKIRGPRPPTSSEDAAEESGPSETQFEEVEPGEEGETEEEKKDGVPAEKPAIETEENYEMFNYYVEKLVEDSKAEGITVHPAVFSAEMHAKMKQYDKAFDYLEQAQKYHERYLAEKKDIEKKKDESGSGDVIRYEGHDLDLLFGGPKLTAEQAAERMRNVLGSNYDERIKITGATDGMTLAKVVTHVDVPMGTPAAKEIEKYLREQEAAAVLDRSTADATVMQQGGGYKCLSDKVLPQEKSEKAAKSFWDRFRPEKKAGVATVNVPTEVYKWVSTRPSRGLDSEIAEKAVKGKVYGYNFNVTEAEAASVKKRIGEIETEIKDAKKMRKFGRGRTAPMPRMPPPPEPAPGEGTLPEPEKEWEYDTEFIKVGQYEEDGQPEGAEVDSDALENAALAALKEAEEELGLKDDTKSNSLKIAHKDGAIIDVYECAICRSAVGEEDESCPECGTTFVEAKEDGQPKGADEEVTIDTRAEETGAIKEVYECPKCHGAVIEEDDRCGNCGVSLDKKEEDVQPDPAAAVEAFGKDFNKSLNELKEKRAGLQKDIDNDFKKYTEPKKGTDVESSDAYIPAATNATNENPSILQSILDEITTKENKPSEEGENEGEKEEVDYGRGSCDNCGRALKPRWASCPYCGEERVPVVPGDAKTDKGSNSTGAGDGCK